MTPDIEKALKYIETMDCEEGDYTSFKEHGKVLAAKVREQAMIIKNLRSPMPAENWKATEEPILAIVKLDGILIIEGNPQCLRKAKSLESSERP